MKKVLISDNLSAEGIEIFKKTPGIEVDVQTKMTADELKAVIKDYDALVIRSATKVTQEIIDLADKLVIVGRAGIGLDNVDIPAATKRGIVVMNTPGGNAVTTGEHAIAMMLSLVRHIPQATASMKAGKWEKNKFTGHEFLNKTLGIVGIGRVGSIVADRAQGLKMKVIAYDPFISPEAAEKAGITLATPGRDLCAGRYHHDPHPHDEGDPGADQRGGLRQDEEGRLHHQLRPRRARQREGSL